MPCHHAATNDTSTRSFEGRGRSDDTATATGAPTSSTNRNESSRRGLSGLSGRREAPRGTVPEKRRARRGGSFATASAHASCQCLAITPPPATRRRRRVGPSRVGVRMPQLFREGVEPLAGVPSASKAASRFVASRTERTEPTETKERSSTRDRSRRAAASRQHLLTHPASALPSRGHYRHSSSFVEVRSRGHTTCRPDDRADCP